MCLFLDCIHISSPFLKTNPTQPYQTSVIHTHPINPTNPHPTSFNSANPQPTTFNCPARSVAVPPGLVTAYEGAVVHCFLQRVLALGHVGDHT
jgi:hypothetical protein